MDSGSDHAALAALLRLLEAVAPGATAEAHAALEGAFGPAAGGAREWRDAGPELAAALDAGARTRLEPGALGPEAGAALIQPVRGGDGTVLGFLALAGLGGDPAAPRLVAALDDAAAIALPFVAAARARRAAAASPRGAAPAPIPDAVLPRAAAHRLIETARSLPDAGRALFLVDLDRFHAVNEALGEAAGDALLAVTGARLEACLGPGDRLARLEGDRFLVVAAIAPEAAAGFGARLLAAARQPLTLSGRRVVIRASIGAVAGAEAAHAPAAALSRADAALRRAKAEGRDRCVLHEPLRDAAALDVSRLEFDLAEARTRGQMRLVYQPYLDLASGAVSGAEALLRWTHPGRGEIAPAAFIPIAEATGLILPLGAWALATALGAAARWPARLAVSVNVSALQFHQPGFVAEVDAALAASGVAPERLELEITETVLMRDNPQTLAQLDALIARGVRIALDDFGTGYSALAYLARLPHHRIKLDRAFVRDLGNPATAELVGAIIALARKSGVCVTAEGVERPDQLAAVRALGFTHAQGFAVGAPAADPIGGVADRVPAL